MGGGEQFTNKGNYALGVEKETATHSRILAWEILWAEEPGRLQSMGSQESDDLATKPPPHALGGI